MENKFAERLDDILKEKHLSKRQCAILIGVSAMSVSDWTNGKIQPNAESIYKTAQCLGVTTDYLLGLTDEY